MADFQIWRINTVSSSLVGIFSSIKSMIPKSEQQVYFEEQTNQAAASDIITSRSFDFHATKFTWVQINMKICKNFIDIRSQDFEPCSPDIRKIQRQQIQFKLILRIIMTSSLYNRVILLNGCTFLSKKLFWRSSGCRISNRYLSTNLN